MQWECCCLFAGHEAELWEIEQRQLHERHQLARTQLKETFFLQRSQMLNRHKKVSTASYTEGNLGLEKRDHERLSKVAYVLALYYWLPSVERQSIFATISACVMHWILDLSGPVLSAGRGFWVVFLGNLGSWWNVTGQRGKFWRTEIFLLSSC